MPANKKYFTEEERKEAKKRNQDRCNHSEKGKASMKRFYDKLAENPEKKAKYAEKRKEWFDNQSDEKKQEMYERGLGKQKQRRKKDPRKPMASDAKKRAKLKNLEFNITFEDVYIPEFCPVLGIELFVSSGTRSPNSPSLDRIDNSKGYTKDNIMVISLRANQIKNDASVDELKAIVKYIEENLDLVRD